MSFSTYRPYIQRVSQLLRKVFLSETLCGSESFESFFILLQKVLSETEVILLEYEFEAKAFIF